MNGVGRFSPNDDYNINNPNEIKSTYKKDDIDLEDISILYSTTKTEDKRTTFNETFSMLNEYDSKQGSQFLAGLKENKQELMSRLGITDEQYDTLACTALALASQETGMGEEKGYVGENTGIGSLARGVGKWFSTTFKGDSSASSGLTQMKIFDFMKSDSFPEEYKMILKDMGIQAKGISSNNLYKNPDKAAIATIVVLKSINDNYQNYTEMLRNEHDKLAQEIAETPEKRQELEDKGNELLDNILQIYKNAPDDQKVEIRNSFKMWLLAKNGSKTGDKVDKGYNEEENLNKLNSILSNNSENFEPITEEELHFIRYALTAEGKEMSPVEYMAYGWNKGTEGTGMQLDRTLADKVGTILYNPEDFDYDQFTTNVATLAEKYANQSVGENSLDIMNDALLDDFEW